MEKFTRFCGACIIVSFLVIGGFMYYDTYVDTASSTQNGTVKGAAIGGETSYTLNESSLKDAINNILSDNTNLDTSVSIIDLQTHKQYHWGDEASYTAASIGKLVTATAYLRNIELGKARLSDNVGQTDAKTQLTRLITKSDNTAWQQLNAAVTKQGLEKYAKSLGLNAYTSTDNTMTSSDIALLLEKLASQKLLNKEHSEFLLSLMKEADMRSYIVAAIPDNAEIYHKVGYLADRLHDAAIIKRGDRSYVLVVFSKSVGAYDFYRGSQFFGEITKASLTAFFSD